MASRIAIGTGLLLPRSYYNERLRQEVKDWRRNKPSFSSILTYTPISVCTTINPSRIFTITPTTSSKNILLFQGTVCIGPWVKEKDIYCKEMVKLKTFPVDEEKRRKMLLSLGLDEKDWYQAYGLYIQYLH